MALHLSFNSIFYVSLLFYAVFLWLYSFFVRIIAPWNPKARNWLRGRKNIFETISASIPDDSRETIWMHCASLGEFEQGRPIIESLKKKKPGIRIVLTFFSPSGYEIRKNYKGADFVFYLPMDSKSNAKRFISLVRPDLVLWIKYDYWFYYLHELKKKDIPVLLISASFRSQQTFFKWYGRLNRYMLVSFSRIFLQNTESDRLLAGIGIQATEITGDTRFDRVIEIAERFEPIAVVEQFCGDHQVIVAGSTWEEDEEELDHYANSHPEIKFIIAPHEVDETHLREIENMFHSSIRFSSLEKKRSEPVQALARGGQSSRKPTVPNVLIIDNIGLLSRLYHYGTINYVGGGFGNDGVHNVLEAAVYGKPVVFGPVIEKYIEAMELVDCGGGIIIDSALEAEGVFNRLVNSPDEYQHAGKASRDYVYSKRGATEKVVDYIQENRLLTS